MSFIDALSLSFKAPVRQEHKSITPVTDVHPSEDSAFSRLFHVVSSGRQKAGGENQQGEMLVKIEEALKAIQALPKETLSSEEMEILASMLQMFAQQASANMGSLQENQQPGSVSQQTEKLPNGLSAINFEQDVPFMGADEKKLSMPLHDSEQGKSVIALVKELEQQQAGKPLQGESSQKLLQQLNSLLEEMTQVTEQGEIDREPLKIESSLPLTGGQKESGNILDQATPQPGNGGNQSEPLSGQTNSAPLTGMLLNNVQESPAAPKAENSQQTSAVRFSHLIEDLGDIFRGTIRLQSNSEAAQMRVNIFPEHLGHLDIVLTSSEGKVTAQIFTASLAAKEALDLQISQLRNALIQQGVSVEKIEVAHQQSHQSFGEQHAHHDQRSSQQQRQGVSQRSGYFPLEEESPVEHPHYAAGSVQVDYTV
ncbi:flagellar hook-length control protein FliK [Mesobacillus campisalis]|uniref:flagellar hook-length control protein FliK n=1 Tax=Mesobacillus campisalis TaxID=1408103 RepID=UPI00069C1F84|nr:flagellar hook-length control protein FliK [Mesobacillus campisalis]